MTTRTRQSSAWQRLQRLRRQRRVQNMATFTLVLLGPVLAMSTFLILGPLDQGSSSLSLRLILLADFVYVLLVAALVLQRIAALVSARRAQSAGSRLHLRLTGAFAILALIPTVSVAIFAALTVNVGLEGWFSDRVRQVVGSSLEAAEAYEDEHRRDLRQDAQVLANILDATRLNTYFMADANIRNVLAQGQAQIQRGLREAYVIDASGEIRARGDRSYLFDFEKPTPAQFEAALTEDMLIIEDWANNEFRALVPLKAFVDRYLYVSRDVDGELLSLLDDTKETAKFYQQLENERGRVLFEFGLIYLGFAVILILAAIWLGLWFAERLSRPVGSLTGAAKRVGAGDLDVQVVEEDGDDEIAMLGRYFNQMTKQLKAQRDTLLENTRQIERRRLLFDSVLSSVTSGVVGLDAKGRVAFVNRSAQRLLDWHEEHQSLALELGVPEFGPLFQRLVSSDAASVQEEVKVTRNGRLENLLVRMSPRYLEDGRLEGYVVAFDDVTNLVAAQRMAAWGDVARRIAHEIKNPLTPIQLSAERIKRKFSRHLDEPLVDDLQQLTSVIVRQTSDIGRIVDEFSKFARMPEPELRTVSLTELIGGAVLLQRNGQPDVTISTDLTTDPLMADLDATMINQALTNLLKNAGEAIEGYREKLEEGTDFQPEIRVRSRIEGNMALITIADNGIGLPEDRARLFEPYVTTRNEGTGLGLPIVRKIVEEHDGTLELVDADPFDDSGRCGAMAVIRLPLQDSIEQNQKQDER